MTEHFYFDNFAIQMPTDIVRHPDGTPVSGFADPKELKACRKYLRSLYSEVEYAILTGAEKEGLIQQWRDQYGK